MIGFSTQNFWATTARIILRNRITILIGVFLFTIFMSMQWKDMRFSNTEANLLPDNHPVNLAYQDFVLRFGEEGNIIAIAVKDSALFGHLRKLFLAFSETEGCIGIVYTYLLIVVHVLLKAQPYCVTLLVIRLMEWTK